MVTVSTSKLNVPSSECNPYCVIGNELYIGANYDSNPDSQGGLYVMDIETGNVSNIFTHSRWTGWKGTYVPSLDTIFIVGEAFDNKNNVLRAHVTYYSLSKKQYSIILHPETGDCNELISFVISLKDNVIIAGERCRGGNTEGSKYPNGAGLWVIPLDTLDDTRTWSRVYENSDGSEFRSMVLVRGWIICAKWLKGRTAYFSFFSIDEVLGGRPVENTWTSPPCNSNFSPYIHCDGEIVAVSFVDTSNRLVAGYDDARNRYVYNINDDYTFIHLGKVPISEGRTSVAVCGRYIFVSLTSETSKKTWLYMIDTKNGGVTRLLDKHDGVIDHFNIAFDGKKTIYTTLLYTGQYQSDLLTIMLDKGVVTTVVVKGNPLPDSEIEFEVTAKYEDGTPVSNAYVSIVQVDAVNRDTFVSGDVVARGKTNKDGKCTLKVRVPRYVRTWMPLWYRVIVEP